MLNSFLISRQYAERTHNGSTALSSVTYDIFADEIRDVTESELQRELQQNEEAIYENQTRSSRSRAAWPKAQQHQTGLEEPFEKNASMLDQERFSEPQVEEGHNQERPSFRECFLFSTDVFSEKVNEKNRVF